MPGPSQMMAVAMAAARAQGQTMTAMVGAHERRFRGYDGVAFPECDAKSNGWGLDCVLAPDHADIAHVTAYGLAWLQVTEPAPSVASAI